MESFPSEGERANVPVWVAEQSRRFLVHSQGVPHQATSNPQTNRGPAIHSLTRSFSHSFLPVSKGGLCKSLTTAPPQINQAGRLRQVARGKDRFPKSVPMSSSGRKDGCERVIVHPRRSQQRPAPGRPPQVDATYVNHLDPKPPGGRFWTDRQTDRQTGVDPSTSSNVRPLSLGVSAPAVFVGAAGGGGGLAVEHPPAWCQQLDGGQRLPCLCPGRLQPPGTRQKKAACTVQRVSPAREPPWCWVIYFFFKRFLPY